MSKKKGIGPVTVRDPKGLKFVSIVEAAYNKANLSDEEAQRINDTPGLAELIGDFIDENRRSNMFKNEQVTSSYVYPEGYKVKGIMEQVAILGEFFPELKDATFDESIASRPLPLNAEGWFVIPRWEKIAPTYGEAVKKVLKVIGTSLQFYDYTDSRLGPTYLRQQAKTMKAFQKLGDEQKGHDILIVPCQFGLRHRGCSVRRAREVMNVVEFGLGAFAVGVMLLTHPEREVRWEQLHVDCAGDEYAPGADGAFYKAPHFFYFSYDEVEFDSSIINSAYVFFGSASGFLPQ